MYATLLSYLIGRRRVRPQTDNGSNLKTYLENREVGA